MLTDYIVSETEKLIKRTGSRDPFEICAALDIRVRKMNLKQKIKGFYFYQSRIHNIVIDESLSDTFSRILVAHELGHAVLHKDLAMLKGFTELEIPIAYEKEDSPEREANLFAAELLLDDDTVLDFLKDHTFFEAAALLNVPAALLDFKFYILNKKGYLLPRMHIAKSTFLKELPVFDRTK